MNSELREPTLPGEKIRVKVLYYAPAPVRPFAPNRRETMRPLPCLRRDSLLLSLVALAALSASCGQREASESLQRDSQSAQTLVAQADALYAQRSSIEKARQEIAAGRLISHEELWAKLDSGGKKRRTKKRRSKSRQARRVARR